MRLYCKVFILICMTVGVQKFVMNDWRHNETVFMARCLLASGLRSEWLMEGVLCDAQYFIMNDANFYCCTSKRTNAAAPGR